MASMMAILALGCGSSSATTNESTDTAKSGISTVTEGKKPEVIIDKTREIPVKNPRYKLKN